MKKEVAFFCRVITKEQAAKERKAYLESERQRKKEQRIDKLMIDISWQESIVKDLNQKICESNTKINGMLGELHKLGVSI